MTISRLTCGVVVELLISCMCIASHTITPYSLLLIFCFVFEIRLFGFPPFDRYKTMAQLTNAIMTGNYSFDDEVVALPREGTFYIVTSCTGRLYNICVVFVHISD